MVNIIFVLDENYSMKMYKFLYIKGINELISSQKQINPEAVAGIPNKYTKSTNSV